MIAKILAAGFLRLAILSMLAASSFALADDHGDTLGEATQIRVGDSVPAELDTPIDIDFFRLRVSVPGTVLVESSGSIDTIGVLLTESGVPIVAADDTGTGLNFRFQAELSPGTYFLEVTFGGFGAPGNYKILSEFSGLPIGDDHGDQLDSATPVSLNSSVSGVSESAGDIDVFRVEITQSGVLTARSARPLAAAGFLEESDTIGSLQDSDGKVLAFSDETELPVIDFETVASGSPDGTFEIKAQVHPGTYFVAVQPFKVFVSDYILEVEFGGMLDADDHGDTINSATLVDRIFDSFGVVEFLDACAVQPGERDPGCPGNIFVEIAARLDTSGDRDVFRVELTSRGVLTVGSLSFNDTVGILRNERGGELDRDDDSFFTDFIFQRDLDPGVYFVEVRGFADAAVGPYYLDFAFRPSLGSRTDAIKVKLEEPDSEDIGSGVANIRGWAVSPVSIDRVELFIDGLYEGIIPYGGSRGDVGNQFPALPDSDRSGFSMAFLYGLLSREEHHTITVKAFDADGNFNQDAATFAVESFDESVFRGFVDLAHANVSITGPRSLMVRGMVLGSGRYDVALEFRRATQGFSIESIERTGSVSRPFRAMSDTRDSTSAPNDGVRVTIEEPVEGSTYEGVSNIRGWSIGPAGISHVDLFIDGVAAGRIPFGGSRQDVASVFPEFPNSGSSGFSAAQNYSNLGSGDHTIRIVAVDPEGRFNQAQVDFSVAALPDPFIKDISRIDASGAVPTVRGNSILLRGARIDGDVFDLTIEFRKATQNFAITSVARRTNTGSPTTPPSEPPIGVIVRPEGDVVVEIGGTVRFEGSVEGGTGPVSYAWDFGNRAQPSQSLSQNPESVAFSVAGEYIVTLNIADSAGLEDPDPAKVSVTVMEPPSNNGAPTVKIVSPTGGQSIVVDKAVPFQAQASDPDGDPLEYSWTFDNGSLNGSTDAKPVVVFRNDLANRKVSVKVEVRDGQGGRGTDSVEVRLFAPDDGGK